jgi:hypothetical protein
MTLTSEETPGFFICPGKRGKKCLKKAAKKCARGIDNRLYWNYNVYNIYD